MSEPADTPQLRPSTPASIYFALLLFAFAVAAPFIGIALGGHAKGDGSWAMLGILVESVLASGAAAILAIICTIVGAWRSPRSGWTAFAIFLSTIAGAGFLFLLMIALH